MEGCLTNINREKTKCSQNRIFKRMVSIKGLFHHAFNGALNQFICELSKSQ